MGAAIGAGIGAAAGGPLGAAVGGLFGAALATDPLPLGEALQLLVAQQGLALVKAGFETSTLFVVTISSGPSSYWRITVPVERHPNEATQQLEDRVYDLVRDAIDRWRAANAAGTAAR